MEGRRVGAYGWESRAILTRHAFLVGWIVAVVIVVAVHVVSPGLPRYTGNKPQQQRQQQKELKCEMKKKNS